MKLILAACIALFTFSGFGQLRPYSYLVNTGLTDQKFYALSKDNFGRLLLATSKGVYSYNGFKSKPVDVSGLKSTEFTHLLEVGSKVFGLNKAKQLVEFSDGKSRVLELPMGTDEIKWIKVSNKKLIVCTKKAVLRCSTASFQVEVTFEVPFLDGGKNQILDYAEFNNESYALLSSNELVAIKGKSAWTIPEGHISFLVSHSAGLTLIPSYLNKHNAYRFNNARFTNLKRLSTSVSKKVERVIQYNSKLFFCSESSLLVYDLAQQKVSMHIPGYVAQDVLQEENGTIWVATLRKGLVCIPNGDYAVSTTHEFYSLSGLPGVKGFVGLNNEGQLMSFNSSGKELAEVKGLGQQEIQHIIPIGSNGLGAGTSIINFTGTWKTTNFGEHIKAIATTSTGSLVGGTFGLRLYTSDNLEEIARGKLKFTSLLKDPIKGVVALNDDEYLVQTTSDLIIYNRLNGKKTLVNYYNQKLDVIQLVAYQNKALILTASSELLLFQGGKVSHERDLKEVNPDIKIQRIKVEGDYVYLLSDNTIYRYKGIKGEIERLDQLSTMNGLFLRDFVVQGQTVFVATQYGIFKFNWNKELRVMPSFIIGNAYGNYPADSTEANTTFTYKNSWVKFPFEVVELGESHPFVLQYRLIRNEDYSDSSWINSSIQLSELSFEHLEGGRYHLELRLKDPYSSTFSSIHKRTFEVEYHWLEYKGIWFVFGVLSTLLISAYIRNRELKKRANKHAEN